jgi:hypothetical protein
MVMLVHEVFEETRKKRTKTERIQVLRDNNSWALKDILRGSLDKTVEWNLPAGEEVPYEANEAHTAPGNLMRENQKFKYFVKGGPGDKMLKAKREKIFIGLLETVDPNDAELVIDMINKKPPKGITRKVVEEAFPGLLKG